MNVTEISLEHTGRFNRLILDYVNSDEKLNTFYALPHTLENYKIQIENRSKFYVDRALLTNALLQQYESIGGAKESVLENIESLRNENTFTVTTGHQLNIFTGPLYFIYKILHTIRLAEALREAYPKNEFVPIYWMNTEDHDIEEVGQFNLFGKKYVWETDQTGATGRMNPDSLSKFCTELEAVFSDNKESLQMVEVFRKAYTEYEDLATATRYFANELFGRYGLVIIDSDDGVLKNAFAEFFKKDILENKPFHLVKKTDRKLKEKGYRVQVNPREINTFYLLDGVRNRIVNTEKGFHVLQTDIRFTEEELIAELKNHPERFSPNVVLRPLFQEFILPNLTYVGGAGELSYWLQYKDYFNEMKVSFPLLALRNHFLLIEQGIGKRMDTLKLLPEDLFHSIENLVKTHIFEVETTDFDLTEERRHLSSLYSELKTKALEADASLVSSLEAEEKKLQKGIEQWGSRFSRGLKQKNEVSINRIRKIHSKLFPSGYLQERHVNFMSFSTHSDNFIETIHKNIRPFKTQFQALRLK